MNLNNSTLHHHIMKHIVDFGRAPKISAMAASFQLPDDEVIKALQTLQEYHGVVLHPKSSEVWVMHPFSTAPTNFWIEAQEGGWWGNCAWCSLGAAALLARDCTITTTLGGEAKQIVVEITQGQIQNHDLFVHFPIPMVQAWDNVTFTCSTMLMFASENEIDAWCKRHDMRKGDVQPIRTIWEFAKMWYGNHLNPQWEKWTVAEARTIFQRFGLVHQIWEMPESSGRF